MHVMQFGKFVLRNCLPDQFAVHGTKSVSISAFLN